MDTSEWGPAGWKFLHSISFAQPEFPNEAQQSYIKAFFTSLGHVLPCKRCSKHYLEFVEQNPVPAEKRSELTRWLVRLHNNANKRTRSALPVPIPEFTYAAAEKRYAYPSDVLSNPPPAQLSGSLLALAIVFAVMVLIVLGGCVALLVQSCTGGRRCPLNS